MEKAKLAFKELISYISCLDVKNKDHLLDQVMILNYYSEGDMSQVLNVLDTFLVLMRIKPQWRWGFG